MMNEPTQAVIEASQIWCRPDCEHIEMDVTLATAFAEVLQTHMDKLEETQEFAIWLTGCGYDFTQHEYFCKQRDKLLKEQKRPEEAG